LLYGSLHLSGYGLPIEQLEQFRQWGSHTPGHPEYGETPGVEVTTGPLGQGFGMAIGIATAEKHLGAVYNRDGHKIIDHHTYVLCGDGDLMEGISHETASLAGTLNLGKLIVLYDDNLISLDGPTELSFTEDTIKPRGKKAHEAWDADFKEYKTAYPEPAAEFERVIKAELAKDWQKKIPVFPTDKPVATRNAGQVVMQAIENVVPELFGGAADLTSSTKTIFKDSPSFHVDPKGRNVFFGVREFGMCAMVNGMAAHGGLIPFGSTFFVFSDYCRPALRMAALMSVHSLFIFTHDSVGLGEDGPTHQPVEHLMALRAIPQFTDFRPADANETAACWQLALERKSASFMALSRQDLPVLDAEKYKVHEGVKKGAYALDNSGKDIILIATGSEVSLILKAAEELKSAGINASVVSMPSFKIYDEQSDAYKASLMPENTPKLAVEAGATMGWYKYVGHNGAVIGIDRFGASAPGPIALDKLGINVANVVEHAKKLVKK
jgi:transketolase